MGKLKTARRGEGLRRTLREKTGSPADLARLVRHEVNNPLTGILGNAELILADGAGLPEKTRERLATIIYLAVRLRDVLRELEERLRVGDDSPDPGLPARRPAPPLARPVAR